MFLIKYSQGPNDCTLWSEGKIKFCVHFSRVLCVAGCVLWATYSSMFLSFLFWLSRCTQVDLLMRDDLCCIPILYIKYGKVYVSMYQKTRQALGHKLLLSRNCIFNGPLCRLVTVHASCHYLNCPVNHHVTVAIPTFNFI